MSQQLLLSSMFATSLKRGAAEAEMDGNLGDMQKFAKPVKRCTHVIDGRGTLCKWWFPKDDKHAWCVKCRSENKKYRENNPEKKRASDAAYRENNPEKCRASKAAHYENNAEKYRVSNAAWRENNPEKKHASDAAYRENNPEKRRASSAAYRENNPEKCRASSAAHYENNTEKCLASNAAWRENNPEKKRASSAAYYEKNREKIRARQNTLQGRFARMLCRFGVNGLDGSFSEKAQKLGFASMQDLKDFFERQFLPGMSFANHGLQRRGGPPMWHIGHMLIPQCAYDAELEADVLRCFHNDNIAPQWAAENFAQGSRIVSDDELLKQRHLWPTSWNDQLPSAERRAKIERRSYVFTKIDTTEDGVDELELDELDDLADES